MVVFCDERLFFDPNQFAQRAKKMGLPHKAKIMPCIFIDINQRTTKNEF
jgi:hypothetical protein